MRGGQPNPCNVRNLAYLALIENRQFSTKKLSMWDALRGNPRGVSYFVFLCGRLAMPRSRHES